MQKKGISVTVSWVLMIGFAVSLALVVTVWTKNFAEENTERITKDIDWEMQCAERALNAALESPECIDTIILLVNRGNFAIEKVKVRGSKSGSEEFLLEPPLLPTQTKNLNTELDFISGEEVGVLPMAEVDGQFIACPDREARFTC